MMFGSAESEHPRLTNGEIISDDSNLCDHNPPTLQRDRRTDRQTDNMRSQYRALQLCSDLSQMN